MKTRKKQGGKTMSKCDSLSEALLHFGRRYNLSSDKEKTRQIATLFESRPDRVLPWFTKPDAAPIGDTTTRLHMFLRLAGYETADFKTEMDPRLEMIMYSISAQIISMSEIEVKLQTNRPSRVLRPACHPNHSGETKALESMLQRIVPLIENHDPEYQAKIDAWKNAVTTLVTSFEAAGNNVRRSSESTTPGITTERVGSTSPLDDDEPVAKQQGKQRLATVNPNGVDRDAVMNMTIHGMRLLLPLLEVIDRDFTPKERHTFRAQAGTTGTQSLVGRFQELFTRMCSERARELKRTTKEINDHGKEGK